MSHEQCVSMLESHTPNNRPISSLLCGILFHGLAWWLLSFQFPLKSYDTKFFWLHCYMLHVHAGMLGLLKKTVTPILIYFAKFAVVMQLSNIQPSHVVLELQSTIVAIGLSQAWEIGWARLGLWIRMCNTRRLYRLVFMLGFFRKFSIGLHGGYGLKQMSMGGRGLLWFAIMTCRHLS